MANGIYLRLRTGRTFTLILSTICAVWMSWNAFAPRRMQFDPYQLGFPLLILALSVEASIAASMILDMQRKNDEINRRMMLFQLHLMEAVHAHIVGGAAPQDEGEPGVGLDDLDHAARGGSPSKKSKIRSNANKRCTCCISWRRSMRKFWSASLRLLLPARILAWQEIIDRHRRHNPEWDSSAGGRATGASRSDGSGGHGAAGSGSFSGAGHGSMRAAE